MVSNVSVAQVLTRYFVEVDEPLLQFGPLTITLKPLIAVTLLGFALCLAVLALRKKPLAVLAGPALVWVLSLGGTGILDGAFQSTRLCACPSGAHAVAFCTGAGQLCAAGVAG